MTTALIINCASGTSETVTLSNAQVTALQSAPPTFSQTQSQIISQANTITFSIVNQIMPTPTQQAAYNNLAAMLVDGVPPNANSPYYANFNNFANMYSMSANSFANLVISLQNTSLSLASLETITQAQTLQSTTNNELVVIVNNFNSVINSTVTALNALLPVSLSSPSLININVS
jgi:hypothetical protein